MNNIYESLITLIRNAVRGTCDNISTTCADDIVEILELAAKHDVLGMVSKSLMEIDVPLDDGISQQLMVEQYGCALRYQQQKYATDRVCSAFDAAGIRYVLLKGAVIRNLYPEPEMRTSSDIDILVDKCNMEPASKLLEGIGCEYYNQTNHDVSYFTPEGVHIELHHTLINDDFMFGKPLGKPWEHAHVTSGCRYDFDNEFFVYYHYAHMAKHFLNGGFGIRFVLDLWLMIQKTTWDDDKLQQMLRDGGIEKMADAVRYLALAWFGGVEHSQSSALLEEYVFEAGIYGTLANNVIINKRKYGGRLGNFIYRIFIPIDRLKYMYTKLEKYPWLYPWYLVVRFFRIAFNNRNKALTELTMNRNGDNEKSQKVNKLFDMLDIK